MEDPNDSNYTSTNLGTWSSTSDVNTFLSKFNHSTGYKDGNTKLRVGNYVTIQDGTYNAIWIIAGFDMEYNQTAADGTVYNNGYGICLVPQTYVTSDKWNTTAITSGGYISSYMHTTVLPNVVTKLKNVLGSHLVNRNVLLSSKVNFYSNSYTWTTAYATLMSVGQLTGKLNGYSNKYDDGEANYKLPLYNYERFDRNYDFLLRGIYDNKSIYSSKLSEDGIGYSSANYSSYIRTLIYIR